MRKRLPGFAAAAQSRPAAMPEPPADGPGSPIYSTSATRVSGELGFAAL